MNVADRLPEMIGVSAGRIAETSLEYSALTTVHPAYEERHAPANGLHEAREGIRPLPHCEMKMVGHDCERDQPRVGATQGLTDDVHDRGSKPIFEPPMFVTVRAAR
jgi:hypothetical protein